MFINSNYLSALGSSGSLHLAFDKQLLTFRPGDVDAYHTTSPQRIVSMAAAGSSLYVVACGSDKSKILQPGTNNQFVPADLPVPAGRVTSISFSTDGEHLGTVSNNDQVSIYDLKSTDTPRVQQPGRAVKFMENRALIQSPDACCWHAVRLTDLTPTSIINSSSITVSPDGQMMFEWDTFLARAEDRLISLRPLRRAETIYDAAFSARHERLYILSEELADNAGKAIVRIYCFMLSEGDETGEMLFSFKSSRAFGAGVWVLP